jgi:ERF superfamily
MNATLTPAEVITTLPAVPSGGGLVGAIAAVMNEVHVVAKRGENEFHRYRYATMGDILKEITPLLGRHGIVIFQSETGRAMFDDDNVIAVEYAFTVAHASGETWPHVIKQTGVSTCRNSKGGWDDKSLNKCHAAARKYFLWHCSRSRPARKTTPTRAIAGPPGALRLQTATFHASLIPRQRPPRRPPSSTGCGALHRSTSCRRPRALSSKAASPSAPSRSAASRLYDR